MDIFSTLVNVAQTAEYAWALYSLIKDARKVDENVNGIAAEVEALGNVCKLSHAALEQIVDDFIKSTGGSNGAGSAQFEKFWKCINSQLDGCNTITRRLTAVIEPLKSKRKNFVRDLYRQVRLSLSEDDIRNMRSQMHSHSNTLSIALDALSMKVQYLSLNRIDDNFRIRLESLEIKMLNTIETWGNKMQACVSQQLTSPSVPDPRTINVASHSTLQQLPHDTQTLHSSVHDGFVRLLSIADSYKNEGYEFTDADEDKVYLLGFVEDVVSESGRTLEQSVDGAQSVADVPLRQFGIGSSGVDIASWISKQPSGSQDDQAWVRAPPTLPRSAYSVAGDRYYSIESTLDTLQESDESDDDENVEMSKWTLQTADQAYKQARWAEAYDFYRIGLQMFQQRPLKHKDLPVFWQSRYKLVICAFNSQSHSVAEEVLCSFAAAEASDDEQRLKQCKAGLLLAKVYARQKKLDLASRSCRTARRGMQRLKGSENDDVYDALALQSRLYTLIGTEESLRNAKVCSLQIPDGLRDDHMLNHQDLLLSCELEQINTESKAVNNIQKINEDNARIAQMAAEMANAMREDEEIRGERTIFLNDRKTNERGNITEQQGEEVAHLDAAIVDPDEECKKREQQIQHVHEETAGSNLGEKSEEPFASIMKPIENIKAKDSKDTDSIGTSGSTTGADQSTLGGSLMHRGSSITTASVTARNTDQDTAATSETDQHMKAVTDAFAQFAKDEKRMKEVKETQKSETKKAERNVKLNDLKKFAAGFKLKTRIPQDLVPFLTKDHDKQVDIQRRADELAKEHEDQIIRETGTDFRQSSPHPGNHSEDPVIKTDIVTSNPWKGDRLASSLFSTNLVVTASAGQEVKPGRSHSSSVQTELEHQPWRRTPTEEAREQDASTSGAKRIVSFVDKAKEGFIPKSDPSKDQKAIFSRPSQMHRLPLSSGVLGALDIHPKGPLEEVCFNRIRRGTINLSSHRETPHSDGEATTSHVAALFGDVGFCRSHHFDKDKHTGCVVISRYTYAKRRIRPIDIAMATGRAEIIYLAYQPFELQWPHFEDISVHEAPAYLFHSSWISLTGSNTQRVLDVLELIVPQLFQVNTWMNGYHWTLLHFAVSLPQEHSALRLAATEWLLNHGASRGATTKGGDISLHLVAENDGAPEIAALLLRNQAREQLESVNQKGQTPLDLAIARRVQDPEQHGLDVIKILHQHYSLAHTFDTEVDVARNAKDHELESLLWWGDLEDTMIHP